MKRLFVFFTLIACFPTHGLEEIVKKYDWRTKTTKVYSDITPKRGNPRLVLSTAYSGKKFGGTSPLVYFGFVSIANPLDRKFHACNATTFLLDGRPFSPGDAVYKKVDVYKKGDYLDYVLEMLGYPKVTFSVIKMLAMATKIEVKICDTIFTLTAEEMKDLKKFVRLFTPE